MSIESFSGSQNESGSNIDFNASQPIGSYVNPESSLLVVKSEVDVISPNSSPEIIKPMQRRRTAKEAQRAWKDSLADEGQFEAAWLSTSSINVLPQPRRTFENISELADSLAHEKLINPSNVVQLDEENAKEYLRVISKVQKTDIQTEDLVASEDDNGKKVFNILIAGERRFRAIKHLKEYGCSDCQEKAAANKSEVIENGEEIDEVDEIIKNCYPSHFFNRQEVEVRLGKNISARNALNKQSAENMHMRVPPHEDALFLYNYWQFIKDEDPNYPLAAFSKDAGRSEGFIRDAIKYCNLPDIVRDRVEQTEKQGRLPYSAAIEISRLLTIKDPSSTIEMGGLEEFKDWLDIDAQGRTITGNFFQLSEDELNGWVNKYFTNSYKLNDYREAVTNYIKEREGGQVSMFDIMSDNQREIFEHKQTKLVVEGGSVRSLHAFIQYCTILEMLYSEGKLGVEDSPFSEGSPAKLFLKLANLMERVIPSMSKKALSGRQREYISRQIGEMGIVASEIISMDMEEGEKFSLSSNNGHSSNGSQIADNQSPML